MKQALSNPEEGRIWSLRADNIPPRGGHSRNNKIRRKTLLAGLPDKARSGCSFDKSVPSRPFPSHRGGNACYLLTRHSKTVKTRGVDSELRVKFPISKGAMFLKGVTMFVFFPSALLIGN